MAVMVATIFCQYLFTSVNELNDKREFLFILGIEFLLVILELVLGYSVGIYFCIAAYIIGLVLPIFLWENLRLKELISLILWRESV